jgi:hypothetical protein
MLIENFANGARRQCALSFTAARPMKGIRRPLNVVPSGCLGFILIVASFLAVSLELTRNVSVGFYVEVRAPSGLPCSGEATSSKAFQRDEGGMMRVLSIASIALAGLLTVAASDVSAQQDRGGIGGALDTLNRAVNPDQDREQRMREEDRRREEDRYRRDQRSGASERTGPDYRQYSDRDLRDRSSRLEDEALDLERERRAVENEMNRRGMRR